MVFDGFLSSQKGTKKNRKKHYIMTARVSAEALSGLFWVRGLGFRFLGFRGPLRAFLG